MYLYDKIAILAERNGLPIRQVFLDAKISFKAVKLLKSNATAALPPNKLVCIARILGVPVEHFIAPCRRTPDNI